MELLEKGSIARTIRWGDNWTGEAEKGRAGQRELPGTVQQLLASDSWAQILVVPLCDLPWALVSPSVSQSCCKDAVELCIWDGD